MANQPKMNVDVDIDVTGVPLHELEERAFQLEARLNRVAQAYRRVLTLAVELEQVEKRRGSAGGEERSA